MPKIFKVSFFVLLGILYSFSSTMAFAKQSAPGEGRPIASKGKPTYKPSSQCDW